jgi:predicted amidophosphoribosyltransferase
LKFGGDLRLAPLLARLIFDATRRNPVPGSDVQLPMPILLAPVPLGLARLQERGFNQALEIARPLGKLMDIPVQPRLLERKKETEAQSALPVGARAQRAFGLRPALRRHGPGARAACGHRRRCHDHRGHLE